MIITPNFKFVKHFTAKCCLFWSFFYNRIKENKKGDKFETKV